MLQFDLLTARKRRGWWIFWRPKATLRLYDHRKTYNAADVPIGVLTRDHLKLSLLPDARSAKQPLVVAAVTYTAVTILAFLLLGGLLRLIADLQSRAAVITLLVGLAVAYIVALVKVHHLVVLSRSAAPTPASRDRLPVVSPVRPTYNNSLYDTRLSPEATSSALTGRSPASSPVPRAVARLTSTSASEGVSRLESQRPARLAAVSTERGSGVALSSRDSNAPQIRCACLRCCHAMRRHVHPPQVTAVQVFI